MTPREAFEIQSAYLRQLEAQRETPESEWLEFANQAF